MDISQLTHKGVEVYRLRRFDTSCVVHVIDLQSVKVKIANGFSSVTDRAVNTGASLAFNANGWGLQKGNASLSNEYMMIEGVVIQATALDYRPCMNISKDGQIEFLNRPHFTQSYNVIGFDRYIAQNGIYNARINDNSVAPRTVYGRDRFGSLVVLVCEGRRAGEKGLTFKECWSVMVEFGVTDCGNADGGYSSAAYNDQLGGLLITSYKTEYRRTVNQFLVFASQLGEVVDVEVPPIDTTNGKKFIVVNTVRPRSAPSMFTPSLEATLPTGTIFTGMQHGEWVQMDDGRFVVMNWMGKEYVKEFVQITPSKTVYGQVLDKWMVDKGVNVFIADNIPNSFTSIPAVGQMVQLTGDKQVNITKPLAQWWYKIQASVCPPNYPHDDLVKTLLNLTMGKKAFTNKMGWDVPNGNRREYWSTNSQDGKREDLGLLYCYSSGSTYKIIGERRISGKNCWVIEAMDALDPATLNIEYKGNEHLFTIATSNSRNAARPNGFMINPFPRLYDRSYTNYSRVLVPLLANGRKELYIEKKYIRILGADETCPAYPYGTP